MLPHRKIGSGNRQPAEREKVSAGLGYSPDLCPSDFMYLGIDHIASAFRATSLSLEPEHDHGRINRNKKEGRSPLS